PADRGAAGPNHLIQVGAKLIRGAQDVLDEMQFSRQLSLPLAKPEAGNMQQCHSSSAERLLECLTTPLHVDDLTMILGLPVNEVSSLLLQLELTGAVEELAAGVFQRVG
ncbi:MAG: DNA-protecting protein DprA, partial [Firmicutes bacterium]|nr:DNA-protecting protein DprA [Bacillota bacterium]